MNVLENKFQEEVIKFLKNKRIYHFRFQAQSNLNGMPDVLALYKGYFIGLELKKKGGEPTNLQERKIKTINENGGLGIIVDDIEDVSKLIRLIDNCQGFESETILKFFKN